MPLPLNSARDSLDQKPAGPSSVCDVRRNFAVAALEAKSEQELRIIDAAHRCIGRWGVSKTTVEDIAREAGLSRATVYRVFPDGRDSIVDLVSQVETARFFIHLSSALADAESLEGLLVIGMSEAWRMLSNDEVLAFLLAHEPEVVLRNLAFDRLENLISICREIVAPYLEQWLDPYRAGRLAEWATRVVVSFSICPPDWIDFRDPEAAATVVKNFFMPVFTGPEMTLGGLIPPVSNQPSVTDNPEMSVAHQTLGV